MLVQSAIHMIYDCIYVEDPIVTHRQCVSDGSAQQTYTRDEILHRDEILLDATHTHNNGYRGTINSGEFSKLQNSCSYRCCDSPLYFIRIFVHCHSSIPTKCSPVTESSRMDKPKRMDSIATKHTWKEECMFIECIRGGDKRIMVIHSILFQYTCMCNAQQSRRIRYVPVLFDGQEHNFANARHISFQCAKSKQCRNVVHITVKSYVVCNSSAFQPIHLGDADAYRTPSSSHVRVCMYVENVHGLSECASYTRVFFPKYRLCYGLPYRVSRQNNRGPKWIDVVRRNHSSLSAKTIRNIPGYLKHLCSCLVDFGNCMSAKWFTFNIPSVTFNQKLQNTRIDWFILKTKIFFYKNQQTKKKIFEKKIEQ